MADYGAEYTDKKIEELEKRITSIYREASHDVEMKMRDFNKRYKAKEAIYAKKLKNGEITQEDFNAWKRGQVFQGKQWQAKKQQIENILYNANSVAVKMVNGETNGVFAANANFMSYSLESGAGVNFGFGLYDESTVVNLIKNEPDLLPKPRIKKPKDEAWNSKKITRQITQGITQGESLDDIATRLAKTTGSQNRDAMLTHARTAMTGAQNAGRQYQLGKAQDLGIKLKKEWMATLDSHTRDTHEELDGQRVPINEPFEAGGYSIMYPGDPSAAPAMVYNCRCTMVADIEDYPAEYNRYDNIEGKPISNMTYREWEKTKGKVHSQSEEPVVREFNQVGIGLCRTVQEVNDLLNGGGLFRSTMNFTSTADLTGCDLDSAKSVAATYEQVFAKYPQLKGKLDAPNAHPKGMEDNTYAWCYTRNGGRVEVNPAYYSNWNNITRQYEQDVMSGWHPKGTTAESIVTHEVGHAIDGLLAREGVLGGITATGEYRYASSTMRNTIMKRAAKKDEKIAEYWEAKDWSGKADKHCQSYAIEKYVSRYATKNPQEWFAECFAEYITSANPRVVATEFGKELERLVKKIQ